MSSVTTRYWYWMPWALHVGWVVYDKTSCLHRQVHPVWTIVFPVKVDTVIDDVYMIHLYPFV